MQQRATLLIEYRRTATVAATSSRSGKPRHRALADQVALELCERAEHVEDEPAAAGRRVDALVQRTKPDAPIAELVHALHEVDQRAAEPVQLPHHDGVTLAREGEGLGSPGSISIRASRNVSEHLATAGALELIALEVELLVSGRDARVPDEHGTRVSERTDGGRFMDVDFRTGCEALGLPAGR
jgi:hypothetical protein